MIETNIIETIDKTDTMAVETDIIETIIGDMITTDTMIINTTININMES